MSQLYLINPRKRRGARKSVARKGRRSAAQRAATARMLAANRSRHGHRVHRNPVAKRSAKRRSRRPASVVQRRARRAMGSMHSSGAMGLLKSGATNGAGAVAVDVLFGYAKNVLPASLATPMNSDGSTNWMYFAAKAALAVGVATAGRRFIPAKIANAMGEGALTVMSYQIVRGMLPSSIALGAYNPVPTMNPARMAGMNAYAALPVANTGAGPGTAAAFTANAMARR